MDNTMYDAVDNEMEMDNVIDVDDEINEIDDYVYRKRGSLRYEREKMYKKRLERLYNITKKWYPSAAMMVRTSKYRTVKKPYIKRIYMSNNGKHSATRYFRKVANRKVRRYKGIIPDGGSYKKVFDYWWEIT